MNKEIKKLERQLEGAYDDLEDVETMFDHVTQANRLSVDYCLEKRKIVCERIKTLKQEIELCKQYEKLIPETNQNPMAIFFLSNVDAVHKIDKIRYKKDTASAKPTVSEFYV